MRIKKPIAAAITLVTFFAAMSGEFNESSAASAPLTRPVIKPIAQEAQGKLPSIDFSNCGRNFIKDFFPSATLVLTAHRVGQGRCGGNIGNLETWTDVSSLPVGSEIIVCNPNIYIPTVYMIPQTEGWRYVRDAPLDFFSCNRQNGNTRPLDSGFRAVIKKMY
jgi:hypothetical protein